MSSQLPIRPKTSWGNTTAIKVGSTNDAEAHNTFGDIDYDTFEVDDLEYIELKGWKSSTVGITNYKDLPENAKLYIKTIEELSKTPVVMISTGPARNEIICLKDIFAT